MTVCSQVADPIFQPAFRIISSITRADPAVIVTSIDHDYVTGEIVRFYIPSIFGMQQLNTLVGTITVTASDTFSVNIDTSSFDAFAIPAPLPSSYTCAQVVPIGEISSILSAATKNTLPSRVR